MDASGNLIFRGRGTLKYELLLLLVSMIWGSAFVAQQIGMQHTTSANSGFITGFYILFAPALIGCALILAGVLMVRLVPMMIRKRPRIVNSSLPAPSAL